MPEQKANSMYSNEQEVAIGRTFFLETPAGYEQQLSELGYSLEKRVPRCYGSHCSGFYDVDVFDGPGRALIGIRTTKNALTGVSILSKSKKDVEEAFDEMAAGGVGFEKVEYDSSYLRNFSQGNFFRSDPVREELWKIFDYSDSFEGKDWHQLAREARQFFPKISGHKIGTVNHSYPMFLTGTIESVYPLYKMKPKHKPSFELDISLRDKILLNAIAAPTIAAGTPFYLFTRLKSELNRKSFDDVMFFNRRWKIFRPEIAAHGLMHIELLEEGEDKYIEKHEMLLGVDTESLVNREIEKRGFLVPWERYIGERGSGGWHAPNMYLMKKK